MKDKSIIRKLQATDENNARSLASIAVDRLRSDIVRCKFQPGEKLRIHVLREIYGINASAIREALSRLVTDELVEAVEQRGFRVAPISYGDLHDLTETRTRIECIALTRAMEIGSHEWEGQVVAALHQVNRASAAHDDPNDPATREAWMVAHRNFHAALVAGSRSRWLMSFCKTLYEQTERYRNLAESRARARASRNADVEHGQIVDAILDRDAELACRRLSAHFLLTTDLILAPGSSKKTDYGNKEIRKRKSGKRESRMPVARLSRTR